MLFLSDIKANLISFLDLSIIVYIYQYENLETKLLYSKLSKSKEL